MSEDCAGTLGVGPATKDALAPGCAAAIVPFEIDFG